MTEFLSIVGGVVALCGCLLFLGGMVSAAREIRAEKAAGLRVTRPAWNAQDRAALDRPADRYRVPRGSGVCWVLVAVGRPDLAERYLSRRAAHHV